MTVPPTRAGDMPREFPVRRPSSPKSGSESLSETLSQKPLGRQNGWRLRSLSDAVLRRLRVAAVVLFLRCSPLVSGLGMASECLLGAERARLRPEKGREKREGLSKRLSTTSLLGLSPNPGTGVGGIIFTGGGWGGSLRSVGGFSISLRGLD